MPISGSMDAVKEAKDILLELRSSGVEDVNKDLGLPSGQEASLEAVLALSEKRLSDAEARVNEFDVGQKCEFNSRRRVG